MTIFLWKYGPPKFTASMPISKFYAANFGGPFIQRTKVMVIKNFVFCSFCEY
jgi:hypothetical protein